MRKRLADYLTGFRLIAAFLLIWMGMKWGADVLPVAVFLALLAWSTDSIDGPLARSDPDAPKTWVGEHDVLMDACLAVGIFLYLTLSDLIAVNLTLIYLTVAALLLLITRSRAILLLAMGGMDGICLYALAQVDPRLARVVVIWIVLVAILDRKRLLEVVRIFLNSAGELLGVAKPHNGDGKVNGSDAM